MDQWMEAGYTQRRRDVAAHAEAERQRANRARADARAAALATAIAATEAALQRTHERMTPDLRALVEHVVDLSMDRPAIAIRWLAPGTRSSELVGAFGHAIAITDRRVVVAPAIVDEVTYAVCLHEIGHLRDNNRHHDRLEGEAFAWRWARSSARMWTPAMQDRMKTATGTYLATAAKDADIFGTLALESVVADAEYEAERSRRRTMAHCQFQREHGIHTCQSAVCLGTRGLAVAKWGRTMVCAACDSSRHLDGAASALRSLRTQTTAAGQRRVAEMVRQTLEG